jgi:flagellin FlaB
MLQKMTRAMENLHRGQKGITGLETAIILIAFVTVASIIAYAVLSAGVFSAERGKDTVYKGLEQAQGTVTVKGSVLGLSTDGTTLDQVMFAIALTVPNVKVDTQSIVINYFDDDIHEEGCSANISLAAGCTERGAAAMLENDEQHTVVVTIPASANLTACQDFTIQVIPPTGAPFTITKMLPAGLEKVMDLH